MFKEATNNILLADNPWLEGASASSWIAQQLPETYVPRSQQIELGDRITLVVGPRQAGKSTLLWEAMSRLESPCLFVNCEEPTIRHSATSPALFAQGLRSLVPPRTVVFFGEVQHLQDAGLFLKGLVDRRSGYHLAATGSSSFELESKTRESLAGRASRHLLLPFSFREIQATQSGPPAQRARAAARTVEQLMVYGGYPRVHLGENKQAILTGLVESFVIRDASDRFRIKRVEAFRRLLELMASQIGNLCNYSEWASITEISADTARDYASLLCETHITRLIPPFVGGKRAEITSTPKVYFLDNGIRNRLFGGFERPDRRPDAGALLENLVFTEIAKNTNPLLDSIHFWRSKSGAEVDFVLRSGDTLVGIEVKAGNARGKLTRSAHSFIDAYSPERFVVINDREHAAFTKRSTEVVFCTPTALQQTLFAGPAALR